MSRDAWDGEDYQPQTLNGWNYVAENPINRTDPSGHCFGFLAGGDTLLCVSIGAVALVGGVTIYYLVTPDAYQEGAENLIKSINFPRQLSTTAPPNACSVEERSSDDNFYPFPIGLPQLNGWVETLPIEPPDLLVYIPGPVLALAEAQSRGWITVLEPEEPVFIPGVPLDTDPPLIVLTAKKGAPKPPGFNPRWKKRGKYWIDPKTGAKWRFHAEDDTHYDHWDVNIPGESKMRIPLYPKKGVFK